MRRVALAISVPAFAACIAAAPSYAVAAERWTSPAATATTGACTAAAPCRIDAAVNDASPGDEVVVRPGTYTVSTEIDVQDGVVMHGEDGQPRPRLTGATTLRESTLGIDKGGVARHLEIRATSGNESAIDVGNFGGRGERLVLWSKGGHAAEISASLAGSVLTDSVAETAAIAGEESAILVRDGVSGGTVRVVNVTAWAPAGAASAIDCVLSRSTGAIVNTVARGADRDIDASGSIVPCTVQASNYRATAVAGVTGIGAQHGDPLFADPLTSTFATLAGSPLRDAGSLVAGSLGSLDLAGRTRVLNGLPDIGAYEHVPPLPGAPDVPALDPVKAPAPTLADRGAEPAQAAPVAGEPKAAPQEPAPATAPAAEPAAPPHTAITPALPGSDELPAGVAVPVLGSKVVVANAGGEVRVRPPGSRAFTTLRGADDLPVGAVVDARAGTVRLSSALAGTAGFQTGAFNGGMFVVRQARSAGGVTDIVLEGGDFSRCRPGRKGKPRAFAAGKRRRAVRRLWGSDHGGRFRTRGRNSVATVRGTRWLTEDRCDGTLTRVVEGAVEVRDTRGGRTRLVRAGGQVLVGARKR